MFAASSATPPRVACLRPNQLHALVFRRFRSLVDVEIRLQSRFTVLIGVNGAGKSSVLDGAYLLSRLLVPGDGKANHPDGACRDVFRGDDAVGLLTTHDSETAALELRMATLESGFRLRAEAPDPNRINGHFALDYGHEWKGWTGPSKSPIPSKSPVGQNFMKGLRSDPIAQLGACVRLRLDARRAREPSHSEERRPVVQADGSGLATALNWLSGNDRSALLAIEQDLNKLVPGTGALRIPRVTLSQWEEKLLRVGDEYIPQRTKRMVAADTVEVEFRQAGFLPISQLSEGTVLALTLLTVLHSASSVRLLLLDGIDQALHPSAQEELVKCIQRLLEQKPELQIIATSHAPYLLDCLQPKEVQVLALDDKGHTHVRSLADHPKADDLRKGALYVSELWSALGETWVLDEREEPAAE